MKLKYLLILLLTLPQQVFGQYSTNADEQNIKFITDSAKIFKELRIMHHEDQAIRKMLNKQKRDSAISHTGVTNTVRLIEILNLYGYPTHFRFQDSTSREIPVVVLFDHADMNRADTLLKLIQNEHRLKRISTNEFELVKWHLNGRVGVPNIGSSGGIKVKKRKKWLNL